ncbi:hypothetical protein OKW09_005296 [Pseudomonas rhodesiae]|nr:hypothetical protein [Pseudomonas rhodesiae]
MCTIPNSFSASIFTDLDQLGSLLLPAGSVLAFSIAKRGCKQVSVLSTVVHTSLALGSVEPRGCNCRSHFHQTVACLNDRHSSLDNPSANNALVFFGHRGKQLGMAQLDLTLEQSLRNFVAALGQQYSALQFGAAPAKNPANLCVVVVVISQHHYSVIRLLHWGQVGPL